MTAWDVVVDPILSGPGYQAWVWDQGGEYFGVPVHNYVGWLATTFAVFVLYRWYEWVRPRSGAQQTIRWAAALPPVAYGAMLLANLVAAGPPALAVIGPFVMGLPLLSVARPLLEYVRAEPMP